MALELALENQLLSHTEVFVDEKRDQQRAVLEVGLGVGWEWLSVNWLGESRSRNRKTALRKIWRVEVCEVKNRRCPIKTGKVGPPQMYGQLARPA